MYRFSDFASVRALPNVLSVTELSEAIGLSIPSTHALLKQEKIPHLIVARRKIIFKEHLLQGLSKERVFTDVAKLKALADLPDVFPPNRLQVALGISHGFAYSLSKTPGFPATSFRNRIVVSKQGLIVWIRQNEVYMKGSTIWQNQ